MQILLRTLLAAIGWLPLPVVHALGELLGVLFWLIPNQHRRVALRNLALCLPELTETQRRRTARRSMTHLLKAFLEAPAIWFGPRWRLARWFADEAARQTLRTALARGKGVIICSPHLGAWELLGLFCSAVGPMTTLYKEQGDASDALVLEGRTRYRATLVPSTGGGVKALLQALKRGEIIGILPDQDPPTGSGVFAPLFGHTAHTSELVTKLVARTDATVFFGYAERLAWGRGFRLHLRAAPPGIADAAQGAGALNRGIEACIRHLPDQYWWSYKRFRRQPPGQPGLYE